MTNSGYLSEKLYLSKYFLENNLFIIIFTKIYNYKHMRVNLNTLGQSKMCGNLQIEKMVFYKF